ncbi:MAG: spore cortex-lytic enzyme [Clostridia bacterium]|nr:spore cortex-lytic enzyme [Clostridia bacterium]
MKKSLKIGVLIFLITVIATSSAMFITSQVVTNNYYEQTAVINAKSSSQDIKLVQRKLKNWGYYTGSIDGIYGSKTKAAVIKFQRNNKLSVDGIIGNQTLKAMGITESMLSGGSSQTSSSVSNQDLYLLAKLINAEARGESYKGQVAVGAVVLNRVKSSSFPNTISGVIYQPYAFTCVNDGQINYSPSQSAISAAKDALNGWDPTNGCIYYYNPRIATNKWIYSRPTVITIGNHVFAK